jgi:regulatory protein
MSKDFSQIKSCAVNLLARREHSQQELCNKLKLRNFSDAEIKTILTALTKRGLQSDERFTESYIHMRANKGYGPLRIQMELQERGVAAEIISEYLNVGDPIWRERAVAVYQKKFGKKIPKDFSAQAKQMRFLQYRGFTLEQIKLLKME